MSFIEYFIESEHQNSCQGTEWLSEYWLFPLVMVWLTGSCGLLPLPSISRVSDHISLIWEEINIQNSSTVSLTACCF